MTDSKQSYEDKGPNILAALPSAFVQELAQIAQAARMQKAIFDEYVKAGFTEQQALYMTAAIMGGAKQ